MDRGPLDSVMDIDLARLAAKFQGRHVVVIGDALLDVYLSGRVGRLCREAPLPIVEIEKRVEVPGGAGNVAINVAALGARATFIGVVGDDREGEALRRALDHAGVDVSHLVRVAGRATPAKHRLLGGPQMLARFDNGTREGIDAATLTDLIGRITRSYGAADAVILADYGYGLFAPELIQSLAYLQRRQPRVVVADSRALARFAPIGVTAVKPSFAEAMQLLGVNERGRGRAETAAMHASTLFDITRARMVAVTLDIDGAVVLEPKRAPYRTYARPAQRSRSTGAGDTFAAAFALALAFGADTPEAAELAAAAASVVVAKDGTQPCRAEELRTVIDGGGKRVADAATLAERMAMYRSTGARIVFTNGCFDILHRGHVTLLNRAKALGDVLIVGINSDASVRRLKGANRPINALEDRIKVLTALSYVDHVAVFDGDSPTELIRTIHPDVYVKGGDYTRESLPEAPLVEHLGGAVCILPYLAERSTSGLIERIRTVSPASA